MDYPHRYSHLRKFYYNIHEKPRDVFQGLSMYKTTERMRFLYPLSMLSSNARSLPSDLALEAVDTLNLYRALSTCTALQPFQQKDVIRYEEALKQHFATLLSSFDPQDFGTPLSRTALNSQPDRVVSGGNLIHLVADLHIQGDLVTRYLLVRSNRSDCEHVARFLNHMLKIKEDEWRKNSPEWKCKMAQYEAFLQARKEQEHKVAQASKHKDDEEDRALTRPDFSFAGQCTLYTASELDEDIADLMSLST
ncbi:hypothetical protein BDR04DRAFT_1165250 [Suillus decipiens]|nr:hypothetical protein BDR04DRAFT_1165250 [Suillus decipiens]